ncbi:helix-turn-helix domain-containing protein [Pseudomonas fontis]|uniref:Helix-turn-helix domain-containing protein n=1 Tax=Pseudomonas fontis TaxID=2942633 RepID=A0ABT5P1B0_9PSED|nr:helix-turn-helix domain-containing protein [Pseudomonas fontis]MDD0975940.1 helix-turn-helix domain-containing protein [Pseudomonas fontis]MDD0994250.1 helix-turn-helix domain-containing protein [Pseudomonas fontis]
MTLRLISVTQAAEMLGIGRSTAYRLAKDGKIPCVRGFGPARIHYQKLVEMIEAGIPATLAAAGVVSEERICRTKEAKPGGLATPRQTERTLDALLAPRTMPQPRL